MSGDDLQKRTMQYALLIIAFTRRLPENTEGSVLGKQLLRSATSAAANYRAARLGRSAAEFYAKLCIVLEEIDESAFWLELIKESALVNDGGLDQLLVEAKELTYVFSSSRKTMKARLASHK